MEIKFKGLTCAIYYELIVLITGFLSGVSATEDDCDDDGPDNISVSDVEQPNTKQLPDSCGPSLANKTMLNLPIKHCQLIRQNSVDHGRGFPHSESEQTNSRSSFAASDYFSVSLRSSSLQVDDVKHKDSNPNVQETPCSR